MFNLVSFSLVHDVMHQQFQTEPLRNEVNAPRLRWRISFVSWTRPMASALRSSAEYLEAFDQPALLLEDCN
jgi:hypothetical protein